MDLPGRPDRQSDQVTSSAKRLISAIAAGIHVTLVLVRCPLHLVAETTITPVPHNVAALRSARLAISFRWLRQRRDPGHFFFSELGIPHTFERPLYEFCRMRARRDAALRLLKTMLVASIVIPLAIFSYASWINYRDALAHADEQLAGVAEYPLRTRFESFPIRRPGFRER